MKKTKKNQLAELKNKYLVDIYTGLSKGDNIRDIHKKLYAETINQKNKGLATDDQMLKVALKSVSSLKKKIGSQTFINGYVKTTYGSNVEGSSSLELIAIFAFDLIKRNKVENDLSKKITARLDKIEGEEKEKAIGGAIEHNRSLENPKIFYLASQHKDSASDHAPYQGKMYIDEGWRSVITDKDEIAQIEKYVSVHNIKTVQWVMGEPVWFITRPNCRHYFMELGVKDVMTFSKTKLLEEHKMETAIGDREYLQTIKHSTNKEWYKDTRNAQLLLEKYKERLSLHEAMYKSVPNKIIRDAIAKDKMLIEKWQKYIDSRK